MTALSASLYQSILEAAPNQFMGAYYLVVKDYARSAEYYDRAVALGMESSKQGAGKARAALKQAEN